MKPEFAGRGGGDGVEAFPEEVMMMPVTGEVVPARGSRPDPARRRSLPARSLLDRAGGRPTGAGLGPRGVVVAGMGV